MAVYDSRKTSVQRGYGTRWRKARTIYLQGHPLCAHCQRLGRIVPASVVDHITPHRGDMRLFWDTDNWQPLCKKHHDMKTAQEDSGFGNTSSPKAVGGCDLRGMPTDPRHPWAQG